MSMKEIRDDRWADWLIDEEHRWENINKEKPARKLLGKFFLLLIYLVISLFLVGLSIFVLHYFDIGKIGYNTIQPFSFSNSDYKYLSACIALVLSFVTVIYKYRKNNIGERVLIFFVFTLVYSFLAPVTIGMTTPIICYVNSCFGVKEIMQRNVVIKEFLSRSMQNGGKSFYRIEMLGTNEDFIFRTSHTIDFSMNTLGTLYMHKGCLGLYAVDSLRISYDHNSKVFIAR